MELMGVVKIEKFAIWTSSRAMAIMWWCWATNAAPRDGKSYQQLWAHAYTLKNGKVTELLLEDTHTQAVASNV